MSQRILKTKFQGKKVTVLAGWDRPLQGYFMVIEDRSGELIYSNLEDEDLTYLEQEFEYFIEKAKSFGIQIPHNMLVRLHEDKVANIGNAESVFTPDGTEKSTDNRGA